MAIIMGYFCTSTINAPIGVLPVLFGVISLVISQMVRSFKGFESLGIVGLTWSVNMTIFVLAVLFAFKRGIEPYSAYALRVFADAVISSMFIVLFAGFVVNLHRSYAYLVGDDFVVRRED